MTKEQWKKRLPEIQAWIEGKVIQCMRTDVMMPAWCNNDYQLIEPDFSNPYLRWRTKPNPREFWLVGGLIFNTNIEAIDYVIHHSRLPDRSIIKVREVLE